MEVLNDLEARIAAIEHRPPCPIRAEDKGPVTIEDGKVFGLVGINGAGKSTTIKSIVGIQRITQGRIIIDDEHKIYYVWKYGIKLYEVYDLDDSIVFIQDKRGLVRFPERDVYM